MEHVVLRIFEFDGSTDILVTHRGDLESCQKVFDAIEGQPQPEQAKRATEAWSLYLSSKAWDSMREKLPETTRVLEQASRGQEPGHLTLIPGATE